jgi:hypothetical protein
MILWNQGIIFLLLKNRYTQRTQSTHSCSIWYILHLQVWSTMTDSPWYSTKRQFYCAQSVGTWPA